MLRPYSEDRIAGVSLLAVVRLHLYPQLIQLLIGQRVELLQPKPELASEVSEPVLVVRPALVEVLGTVETVLEYLQKFYNTLQNGSSQYNTTVYTIKFSYK